MLPGYTQNAFIFSAKLGAIRKAVAKDVDLVFVDPPHVVEISTTSSEQFDSTATADSDDPKTIPRAWWFAKAEEGRRHFTQFNESLVYLRKVLDEQGQFDAVWGFSQGATAAAILTALLERPQLHPAFKGISHPPFKFAIISCGFLPLDESLTELFSKPVETPSLHIIGRGDTIVGPERSQPLIDSFLEPRVEFHDGGHFTPAKQSWRVFFKAYLSSFHEGGANGGAEIASPYGSAEEKI